MEDAEEHLPPEEGEHRREEAKEPEASPIAANPKSFVSVTQSFNTTCSMGRLTLNVLLSFPQFEREVTGERIRDKIAASKKKGLWGWAASCRSAMR